MGDALVHLARNAIPPSPGPGYTCDVRSLNAGGTFQDLFAFGDQDGRALDVKLQHPLAVAWNSLSDKLIVADSYNNKVSLSDNASCSPLTSLELEPYFCRNCFVPAETCGR